MEDGIIVCWYNVVQDVYAHKLQTKMWVKRQCDAT